MAVVLSLFLLSFLIFIHELGHLLAARLCGIGVVDFAIGMGPAVFRFSFRGVPVSVRLLPIGGWVKFFDVPADWCEHGPRFFRAVIRGVFGSIRKNRRTRRAYFHVPPEIRGFAEDPAHWESNATPRQMAFICAAGPAFNLFLGAVIILLSFVLTGVSEPNTALILRNSGKLGINLYDGEKVHSLDGKEIRSFSHLASMLWERPETSHELFVLRDGSKRSVTLSRRADLTLIRKSDRDIFRLGAFGILPQMERRSVDVLEGVTATVQRITEEVSFTLRALGTPQILLKPGMIMGPIGIVREMSQRLDDARTMFGLLATLSLGLMTFNLLPMLPLDGGRIVMAALQAAFGVRREGRAATIGASIGAFLLVALLIFTSWNDIMN